MSEQVGTAERVLTLSVPMKAINEATGEPIEIVEAPEVKLGYGFNVGEVADRIRRNNYRHDVIRVSADGKALHGSDTIELVACGMLNTAPTVRVIS